MAERQPRTRKAIEQPGEDKPQCMRAGFKAPLPGGAAQSLDAGKRRRRSNRIGRVDVDRGAERLRALPERIQRGMIEVLAVGVAVDHRAAELEAAHAAL